MFTTLPIAEIRGIKLIEKKYRRQSVREHGVIIETKGVDLTVGVHLKHEELEWLRDALMHLVVHGPLRN